ncbi:MAG TPA: ABC transporter ATP-binding protein [Porticoccaceae bacterium]|jgi:ABC-2 type transport system ATP-binding protein|nr:ABC transporter ATP-binding protein [Porticoccaceae bacterium]
MKRNTQTLPISIDAQQLVVTLNNKKILNNLSFQVSSGEVYALLGGNGAGKSTALKTLLGFHKPVSGQAVIEGLAVSTSLSAIRKKIAYLPENASLYPHLNAFENIEYFLSLAAVHKTHAEIKISLQQVNLQQDAWQKPLSKFSKGMRQKTAIALALLRDSPILLLDEPTSGLDPVAIDEFNQLVMSLAKQGAAILMVTHDVYGACQVAQRIGLLRDGALVGEFVADGGHQIDTEQVHKAFTAGVID